VGLCELQKIIIWRLHEPKNNTALSYKCLPRAIPSFDYLKIKELLVKLDTFIQIPHIQPNVVNP